MPFMGRAAAGVVARARRAADYLAAPRPPVIAPYHVQRAPLENTLRKTKLFAAIIFLGMIYGYFYALLPPAFLLFLIAPIAVILMFVIWALPDRSAHPPVRAMELLFYGFTSALILWPLYLAISIPGLPWITSTRLFALPMTLMLLVCVSTSPAFRQVLGDALRDSPLFHKLLAAFVAIQVMTIWISPHLISSFKRLFDAQFEWTAMFFASAYIFLKPGRARVWAYLVCAAALAVCIVGVLEARKGGVLWVGNIPGFLAIEDPSVQRAIAGGVRSATGTHRVQAVFGTALNLAEFLALATPFVMFFMFTARNLAIRAALLLLFLPLIFYVILVSQSRLGMVGFFGSCMLYLLVWSYRRWRRDKSDLIGPALVFSYPATFALFMTATFFVGRLRLLIWGGGAHQASSDSRDAMWEMAMPLVAKWPIGYGIGQGASTLGFTNRAGTVTIDSYFLTILLEYGIAGFAVYYGMFVAGVLRAFTYSPLANDEETALLTPLAIALAVFVVIKYVLSQDQSHGLAFMMLGMVVALVHRIRRDQRAKGTQRS